MALVPSITGCVNCDGGGGGGGGDGGPTGFSVANTQSVPSSIGSTGLGASNTSRRRYYLFNDSSAVLRVKLGVGASLTDFTFYIPSQGSIELEYPMYTGPISGIWDSVDGSARVTEVNV